MEEVRDHDEDGDGLTDNRGKSRAENPHIAGKDEEIVTKNIEDATRKHSQRRQFRIPVIAQERHEDIGEDEQGHTPLGGTHVAERKVKQFALSSEKSQKRLRVEEESSHDNRRKDQARKKRNRKVAVCRSDRGPCAALDGIKDGAADSRQQAQGEDDVPDGDNDGHGRHASGSVILPNNCRIHQ